MLNEDVLNEVEDINNVIEGNILNIYKDNSERGLQSQNILSQMRNLVEDIIILWYNKKTKSNLANSYEDKRKAYEELKQINNPKFLSTFHKYLQISKSHYTSNNVDAERLMQKYFYYLTKLKDYAKKEFNLDLIRNIYDYPLNTDVSLIKYYREILQKINSMEGIKHNEFEKARYYIEDAKPIFIDKDIIYELTLTSATDNFNKFDRVVAYTKHEIMHNYSVRISTVDKEIKVFSSITSVKIITNWQVSIRPCEINNLARIFNYNSKIRSNMIEYRNLMGYLTRKQTTLLELVLMQKQDYEEAKKMFSYDYTDYIIQILDKCREIVLNNKCGKNVIRYLLYTMKNTIIKKQLNFGEELNYMSDLCLKGSCFPFEKIPFVMSLTGHIPKSEELFLSLDTENVEDQLLARHILNNVEQNGKLYTSLNKLDNFQDINKLVNVFNNKLHESQKGLKLIIDKNYIYMEGYEKTTEEIIRKLNELTNEGIEGYKESYKFWEENSEYNFNISEEKKNILRNLYTNSKLAIIYGSAGTGKTTLISSISETFAEYSKIYLCNTNAALDNLKRKIKTKNSEFYTIADFNRKYDNYKSCNILIIDECSTVSNNDFIKVLNEANFDVLLLAGDTYQIEAIRFGNWFSYAKKFVNSNSIYELSETFRSKDEKLLTLWKKVRNKDDDIMECIVSDRFSSELNEKIFIKEDDEIILCLAYDGLYGINQINKYLQDRNPNKAHFFGIRSYKVGDPILFFNTRRFGDVLYNNLKGTIAKIEENDEKIYFEVEIDKPLTMFDITSDDINLIKTENNSSLISFSVEKEFENDDDDDEKNNIIPFNIAYALSIHKAQGLEFKSVKVIITKDVEKFVNPNIFYTAITRAKEKLKIFWTAETSEYIIKQINNKDNLADFNIFKNKYEMKNGKI